MRTAKRTPYTVASEERHGGLETDGDEKGQEDEHESAADRVNGRTQGQGQQHAHCRYEAGDEWALPVEGLAQPPHRPLAGALVSGAAAGRELGGDHTIFQPGRGALSWPCWSVSHQSLAVQSRSYAAYRGTVAMVGTDN